MKRFFFIAIFAFFALVALFVYQYFTFHDGKLHVVFCDVGQGDGILIKTPENKNILIDAGPDRRILDCLSKHMPFWDRTIDIAILTHPHSDHYAGYYYVLQRYSITHFAMEDLKNKTAGFAELLRLIAERDISVQHVIAGDRWRVGEVVLAVAGPSKEFFGADKSGGFIGESREFASVIMQLSYGSFDALFTGDSQVAGLLDAGVQQKIDILHVPHHGSASGLDEPLLDLLQPKIAVISVGKNRYGHPTKRTLNLLENAGIKILRTDQVGDVEIVSDGGSYTNL